MQIQASFRVIRQVAAVALIVLCCLSRSASAQATTSYSPGFATPLPIDRGSAAVWQSLQKLRTRGSMMLVVAHPDDEDSGMLAYESRDQGIDTTLLTLNRGRADRM